MNQSLSLSNENVEKSDEMRCDFNSKMKLD